MAVFIKRIKDILNTLPTEIRKDTRKQISVELPHLVILTDDVFEKINKDAGRVIVPPSDWDTIRSIFRSRRAALLNNKNSKDGIWKTVSQEEIDRIVGLENVAFIFRSHDQIQNIFDKYLRKNPNISFGAESRFLPTGEINPEFLDVSHFEKPIIKQKIDRGLTRVNKALNNSKAQRKKSPSQIKVINAIQQEIQKTVRGIENNLEMELVSELATTIHRRLEGSLNIELIGVLPESAVKNNERSKLEKAIQNRYIEAFDKLINSVDKFIIPSIPGAKGSPSIEDDIGDIISEKFLGKSSNKSRKKHARRKDTFKPKLKVPRAKVDNPTFKTRLRAKGKFTSLVSLQNLLNQKLHDSIQKHMGRSTDPPIRLRYQTGRFAHSAKIVKLTRTREDLIRAYYTYMHFPYDVFMPGGKLHKPGRNPQRIIGASIRDLAASITNVRFTTTAV